MEQANCIDGTDGGVCSPVEGLTVEGFANGFAHGVEERIRQQGLDPNTVHDITEFFDLAGGAHWKPLRAADFDASAWGAWECWEHCKIGVLPNGAVGAIPTGDWVAWDSTGYMPVLGFPTREKAEMLCVLRNENAPTRVVHADGSFDASALDFDALRERVEAVMAVATDVPTESAPTSN